FIAHIGEIAFDQFRGHACHLLGVQTSDAPANGGLPAGLPSGLPAGLLGGLPGGGMGENGVPPEEISDERV
ncbi:hypothetical protein ACC672_37785, partial [Rhizobium ruizarguesonis]